MRERRRGVDPGQRAPRRRSPPAAATAPPNGAHVGEALPRERRADGPLLGRLADRGERLARQPRRRLEVLGAEELATPRACGGRRRLGLARAGATRRPAPLSSTTATTPSTVAGRTSASLLHAARADLPSRLVEQVTQALPAPVQADLGRHDRGPGLSGDVVVRQAVDGLQDGAFVRITGEDFVERRGDRRRAPRSRQLKVVGADIEADVGLLGHVVGVRPVRLVTSSDLPQRVRGVRGDPGRATS